MEWCSLLCRCRWVHGSRKLRRSKIILHRRGSTGLPAYSAHPSIHPKKKFGRSNSLDCVLMVVWWPILQHKGPKLPPKSKTTHNYFEIRFENRSHRRIGLLNLKIISFVFLRKSIFSQLWIRVKKQFPEDRKWFPRPFFLDKMKLTLVYKKGPRFLFQATEVLFLKVRKMP